MGTRTVRLLNGPFDGREVNVGSEHEIRAYKNMYGNIMATVLGGLPGSDSMPAYRLSADCDVGEFVPASSVSPRVT